MAINTQKVIVPESLNRARLDRAIPELCNITRAKAQKLIDLSLVFVNDIIVLERDFKVASGDSISFSYEDGAAPTILQSNSSLEINIVYEDEHMLVIDKPAGLTTHPGVGNYNNTLVNALIAQVSQLSKLGGEWRPGIVHRLDKDTSGLMIIAKNDTCHHKLSEAIKSKAIVRKYKALVFGIPSKSQGTIITQIGKDRNNHTKMSVVKNDRGKLAITHYKLLDVYPKARASLVECRLETGRTHQIRVHMSYIGHSIVGDQLYGKNDKKIREISAISNSHMKNFKRQALHSYYLMLMHPIYGTKIELELDLPEDMKTLISSI